MATPTEQPRPADDDRLDEAALTRAMLRSCTRIAMFACNRSYRLLHCNSAAKRLFRLDGVPCEGAQVNDVIAGRPGEAEHIGAVCESSILRGYAEVTVRPAADRSISVLLTIMPLRDDTDGHIGYLLFGMDITSRKRTEEMLLNYQRAVEASGNLITAVDRYGVFILTNQAFLTSIGVSREDVIGRPVGDVFRERGERRIIEESLGRCLHGEEITYERTRPEPDGTVRSFRVTYYPLKGSNADIRGVVMVSEDITARKEAEHRVQEALIEKESLIESLTAALDEVKTLRGFIPICAHCKKVRDDKGYWSQVEDYISAHSEAEFSHGICPDCMDQYFPELKSAKPVVDESCPE